MNKVNTIVLRILQDVFAAKLPQTKLEDSMDLYQDLHMEPLHLLELILTLSAVFDLRITKDDALKVRKIGDIHRFIENAVPPRDIPAAASLPRAIPSVEPWSRRPRLNPEPLIRKGPQSSQKILLRIHPALKWQMARSGLLQQNRIR